MLGDNKALYDLVQKHGATVRTRYFERATLLVKRAVMLLVAKAFLIDDESMIADIFTKACEKAKFIRCRDVMMNTKAPLIQALEASVDSMHGKAQSLCHALKERLTRAPGV